MRLSPRLKERLRREFYPEDYEAALQILTRWDTKACAPGETPARMRTAVSKLALGKLSYLEQYIAAAEEDFRDVLLWAEYSEDKYLRAVRCATPAEIPDATEEAFLVSIGTKPSDNTARLVYADWLEERGDPRAEYVRVLCAWLACRPAEEQPLIDRERKLRRALSLRWLARIRGMPVREKRSRKRT